MEYKSDYEEFKSRVKTYEQNVIKAYALIWERCTKGMKNKIEARVEFATKIENDPIELLKAIKEHSQNFQEHRYNMSIILDSMRGLLNVKQKEGETLQDWTKRFRTAREVLESHFGGPIIIPRIVENMPEHDPNDLEMIKKCQMKSFEGFLAFLYLENADKSRYGSILTGLNTQQSLGNDQYPKTISEANNVLSNHKLDTPLKSRKEQDFNKQKSSMPKERDNSNEQEITLSFAQMEGKCYCCGKAGHRSTTCCHKDRPKAEWAINKAQQSFAQPQVKQSNASVGTAQQSPNDQQPSESRVSTGWAGAHIPFGFAQVDIMRTWILLDNQSSATIFCNPRMINNIHKTNDRLDLQTNAGILSTNMKCDIPEWGEAWFNPNAITNIFIYAEMAKKHRITTDSAKDNAFIVHLPDKQLRFEPTTNGLYVYVPNLKNNHGMEIQMLSSVDENKMFFTTSQFERAKRA
jgi:hypothetical protein